MAAAIAGRIYRQLHDENYFARTHVEAGVSTLGSSMSQLPPPSAFKIPDLMMDAITKAGIPAEDSIY
jgi:hypothetical protein